MRRLKLFELFCLVSGFKILQSFIITFNKDNSTNAYEITSYDILNSNVLFFIIYTLLTCVDNDVGLILLICKNK